MSRDKKKSLTIINAMFGKGLGGIEQVAIDYAQALELQGHTVIQLVHPDAKIIPMMEDAGQHIETIKNYGWWDIGARTQLKHLVRDCQADVMICHGNRSLQLASRCQGMTRVAVAHNYKLKSRRYIDGVIAITEHGRRYWHEHHGWNYDKVAHVPNMIQLPEPHEMVYAPKQPMRFGCMARFVEKKGVDLLLRAFARIHTEHEGVSLTIAGDGEEREALHALARELGIESAVMWLGWVEDKAAFYKNIDVFCLPSHHEPFGIVLLEAMQYGKAIVSTASEGPSEILTHQQHGLLATVGDESGFAKEMSYMIEHPDKAHHMGEAAQAHVYATYHLPSVAKHLDAVIQGWAA